MNNSNEQFVASPTFYDLENIIETKVGLTDSYQALVADLQAQNQQLTEKLIAALEENAKLKEQLFSSKGLAKVSLPNLPSSEEVQPVPAIYKDFNGQMKYIPDLYANQREEESNTKKLRNALLNYASPL